MRYDTYELPSSPSNPGRTVFLLGTAIDGPINSPVPVHTLQEAEAIFGPKEYGDLVRAYTHASLVEGNTIYLMRVTGEYARGSLLGDIDGQLQPVIKFRSIYGGENYNGIYFFIGMVAVDGVEKEALIMELPDTPARAYALDNYRTLSELVQDINSDTQRKKNLVYATSEYSLYPISCLKGHNNEPLPLLGGQNGLLQEIDSLSTTITLDDLYIALEKSYAILEGREVDIICPVPARFDDTHPIYYDDSATPQPTYTTGDHLSLLDTENDNRFVTFHEQLIDFCRAQERFGIMTHGVIGLRELKDTTDITKHEYAYILKLVNVTAFKDRHGLLEFENGSWFDKGYYITVFAGDLTYNEGTPNEHYANGATLYAAILSSIKEEETTTNRVLPKGVKLRFELSTNELKELAMIGVTSVRNSVKHGPVISNGVTAALWQSQMHSVANVRMVQLTIRAVNEAIEDMIGEPLTPIVTERELRNRIDRTLKYLKAVNVLRDYRFDIQMNMGRSSGTIKLDLLTKYSVEFITTGANIVFTQNVGGI